MNEINNSAEFSNEKLEKINVSTPTYNKNDEELCSNFNTIDNDSKSYKKVNCWNAERGINNTSISSILPNDAFKSNQSEIFSNLTKQIESIKKQIEMNADKPIIIENKPYSDEMLFTIIKEIQQQNIKSDETLSTIVKEIQQQNIKSDETLSTIIKEIQQQNIKSDETLSTITKQIHQQNDKLDETMSTITNEIQQQNNKSRETLYTITKQIHQQNDKLDETMSTITNEIQQQNNKSNETLSKIIMEIQQQNEKIEESLNIMRTNQDVLMQYIFDFL